MRRPPQQQLRRTSACSLALLPDRRTSMTGARNRGRRRDVSICGAGGTGSAASANGGPARLRRNAEHSSGTLAADQGVLRAAEEKVGEDLDVMKQKHVQLWDYHGKALGTTCLTISGVVVVAIVFSVIFLTSVRMRGHGK
ncbi:hypothetical protein H4582DRAFT_1331291 [Lactarius indigo]|nr:hypothetical protein H4582DRAFT_1331291 [Lactarius indigo]